MAKRPSLLRMNSVALVDRDPVSASMPDAERDVLAEAKCTIRSNPCDRRAGDGLAELLDGGGERKRTVEPEQNVAAAGFGIELADAALKVGEGAVPQFGPVGRMWSKSSSDVPSSYMALAFTGKRAEQRSVRNRTQNVSPWSTRFETRGVSNCRSICFLRRRVSDFMSSYDEGFEEFCRADLLDERAVIEAWLLQIP